MRVIDRVWTLTEVPSPEELAGWPESERVARLAEGMVGLMVGGTRWTHRFGPAEPKTPPVTTWYRALQGACPCVGVPAAPPDGPVRGQWLWLMRHRLLGGHVVLVVEVLEVAQACVPCDAAHEADERQWGLRCIEVEESDEGACVVATQRSLVLREGVWRCHEALALPMV